MICQTCEKPLDPRNVSGFCRKHFGAGDKEWTDKRRETLRRKYAADPIALERQRALMIANGSTDRAKALRGEAARRIQLWNLGVEAQRADPTFRERWSKSHSEKYMAGLGIPREQWDTYKTIMRGRKVRSHEARQMVLDKHELEMTRFRRELMEARAQ